MRGSPPAALDTDAAGRRSADHFADVPIPDIDPVMHAMGDEARFVIIGEVGGRFAYTYREEDIEYFVDRCAQAGIERILHSYYHSPSPGYPSYLMHKDQLMKVEPYRYGSGSPLARLVERAHHAHIEVVPFVNVATGGQWIRADYLASGEIWPYVRLIGGGREQAKYWTRTREGKTWLDVGPRDSLGAYGYVSLAYPEVRRRERSLYLEFVKRYGADGVLLEFMIARPPQYASQDARHRVPCCDENGFWAYGYDEPAMAAFRQAYGVDPLALPNADPRWVQFRANYTTQHLRELHQALARVPRRVGISILVFSGIFNSSEDGLAVGVDWSTWLQEGLVDTIYCRIPGDFPPMRERFSEARIQGIRREYAAVRKGIAGRALLIPVIELPTYPMSAQGQATPAEAVEATERVGRVLIEAGAEHLGFWWFDTIEALDIWPAVETLRRALVGGR